MATNSTAVNFPNICHRESDASPWTLVHQCSLDRWKTGHAEAAGFSEMLLTCDGVVHKDCTFSFCMSRQGIININKGSSIFSFRKRSKFAKMAEHFEYNHIPAQMSSINHFRVKSVLCFDDDLVVLHLSRNTNTQFGLLDIRLNKFLGVFGKQQLELTNELLAGALSPDKSKCLVRLPKMIGPVPAAATPLGSVFHLYDLHSKTLLIEVDAACNLSHFCFDPRFSWKRIAVTNFEPRRENCLSLVRSDEWRAITTNHHVVSSRRTLYPYLKDLCYTVDGYFLVATVLDVDCLCRENKARNYRSINCCVHVISGDTAEVLHCIQYRRLTCTLHNCPVNYKPVFSTCGTRMALVADFVTTNIQHCTQVFKLPKPLNLQSMCRAVILQSISSTNVSAVARLPLPSTMISYLRFKPEYD